MSASKETSEDLPQKPASVWERQGQAGSVPREAMVRGAPRRERAILCSEQDPASGVSFPACRLDTLEVG